MPARPVPDPDPFADPDEGLSPDLREGASSDEELYGLDFDPDNSPPDGAGAWLAALPGPLWAACADGMAAAAAPEALAAGFLHADGGQGRGFAAGGALDVMPPGPALAGFADDAWSDGLDRLSDDELIGALCGWRRLASWSAAGEVAAVNALASRRVAGSRNGGNRHLAEHVDSELAAALTLTGRSANRLLVLATGLARLPATAAALADGRIDWPKAMVIIDEVVALNDADAAAVEARVLGDAPGQTTAQLRSAVRRQVLALDPEAAIRRRKKAQKNARVETWTEPSGTAALAGRDLPPADVIIADKHIDSRARWLKARGADGTLDQLRGGVLTALLSGQSIETLLPPGRTGPASDGPGSEGPAGDGPGSEGPAGDGPGSEGPAGEGPGGSGPGGGPPRAGPGGAGRSYSAGPGPAGHGGTGLTVPPSLGGTVNLTVPLATWLGLAEAPGEATGLDVLDSATCRELAEALAAGPRCRWCVTVTGPDGRAVAHGCARGGPGPPGDDPAAWLSTIKMKKLEAGDCTHQRETPAYRAPPSLRHLINIRQRTCSFPGCRRPAVRIDHDHTIPYDQGGRTCECNCAPLCRAHHQAKQAPGWHLEQPEPGILIWTPPSGRKYTVRPDPYPL